MKVVLLKAEGKTCLFDGSHPRRLEDVINEVRMHLTESVVGSEISLKIAEMSKEEFEAHPDFEGY